SDQSPQTQADIARGFEDAVVETLAIKCKRALEQTGIRTLVVAGGVGANLRLRARLEALVGAPSGAKHLFAEGKGKSFAPEGAPTGKVGGRVCFPRPAFCTDNGAMIAFAGALRLQA